MDAIAVPTAVDPKSSALSSPTTAVIPSRAFSSAAVLVTPSKIFSSAAVLVTPSRIFNSAAVDVTAVPLIDKASVSNVPSTSTSPEISKLVASISPLALNITLSPPETSKIIWLSVPNFIRLSSSLPIARLVFLTDVMPVCAASTVIVRSNGSPSEPVLVSVKFVVTPAPRIFNSLALSIVTSVPSSSSKKKLVIAPLATLAST